MPLTIRHTLLALAGSAATALPASAQSLPPAPPPHSASITPAAPTVSGADLFNVIAEFAEAKAAEAAKSNDEIAYTGWVVIRNTYRSDPTTAALMRTQTQDEVALRFRSALLQVHGENARAPATGVILLQAQFLADLRKDNATAKEGTGWVVSKERLEKLHRNLCDEAIAYSRSQWGPPVVRPAMPTVVPSPTHIPLADPTPRPRVPLPPASTSPTYIPLTPTPLPADIQANIDALDKHRQWYAEQKIIWERQAAERQKKWEANLAAIEAGKPVPHPEVKMFPDSMAPTMMLIEDSNKAIDALNNPDKYTPAERERIFHRMKGHEQVNRVLNSDLAWKQLMTKLERQVQDRQVRRAEIYNGGGLNLTPAPTPSAMPTVR